MTLATKAIWVITCLPLFSPLAAAQRANNPKFQEIRRVDESVGLRKWTSADKATSFEGYFVEYRPPYVTVVKKGARIIKQGGWLGTQIHTTFKDTLLSESDRRYCATAEKILKNSVHYRDKVGNTGREVRFLLPVTFVTEEAYDDGALAFIPESHRNGAKDLFFVKGTGALTDREYEDHLYWAGFAHVRLTNGEERKIYQYVLTLDKAVTAWQTGEATKRRPAVNVTPPSKPPPSAPSPSNEPQEFVGTGTGFAITTSGHLVTNEHVIDGAAEVFVYIDGTKVKATILAKDKTNDLAILKVSRKTKALGMAQTHPDLGQDVTVAGFPVPRLQGRSLKVTKGTMSSLSGLRDDIRHFQIDAAVQPGNSGGPLLSDRGDVIGIVNARLNDAVGLQESGALPQNVNYAIKLDYLFPLIKTVSGLNSLVEAVDVPRGKSLGALLEGSVFLIESRGSK